MKQSQNQEETDKSTALSSESRPQRDLIEIDSTSVEQTSGINEYLSAMIRLGPSCFIENAVVEMKALLIDGKVLPIVIAEPGSGKAGVCSRLFALRTLFPLVFEAKAYIHTASFL